MRLSNFTFAVGCVLVMRLCLFGALYVCAQTAPVLTVPALDKNGIKEALFIAGGPKKYLVTNGSDDNIKIWDPVNGRLVKALTLGERSVPQALAWSAAGAVLAVVDLEHVAWVNPVSFTYKRTERMAAADRAKQYSYTAAVFDPGGKTLYVGGGTPSELCVWKVAAQSTVLTKVATVSINSQERDANGIPLSTGAKSMSISPDGRTLLVSAGASEAIRINTADGKVSRLTQAEGNAHAFTNTGRLVGSLFSASTQGSTVKVYEPESFREVASVRVSYRVLQVTAFPRANRCLLIGQDQWAVLDADKGQWEAQGSWPNGGARAAVLSPDERVAAVGGFSQGASWLSLYDWSAGRERLSIGTSVFQSGSLYASSNGARFIITRYGAPGQVKVLRVDQGSLSVRSLPYFQAAYHAAVSDNGQQAMLSGREQAFAFYNAPIAQYTVASHEIKHFRSKVLVSPDGKLGVALTNDGAWVYEMSSQRLLKKLMPKGMTMGNMTFNSDTREVQDATFSPDGRYVAALCTGFLGGKKAVICWDVSSGEERWKLEGVQYSNFKFSPDGRELLAIQAAGQEVRAVWLNPQNGALLRSVRLEYPAMNWDNHIDRGSIAHDLSTLLTAHNKDVVLYDLKTGKRLGQYAPNGTLYSASLLPGSRYGLVAYASFANNDAYHNALELYDFGQQRSLARIFLFDHSDDWAIITPGGEYDASPGAMQKMYYLQGTNAIALEALAAKFYVPRLLSRLLQGYTPPPDEINRIKKPPVVKIQPPVSQRNLVVDDDALVRRYEVGEDRIALTVEATASEGAVAEIRLYHNGKLIGTSSRGLRVEDDVAPPAAQKTQRYEIALMEGDNTFSAVAIGTDAIESSPDAIVVHFKPASSGYIRPPGIQLHLLMVGINQYKNNRYNLNYAVADANAVRSALEKAGASLFSQTYVHDLRDDRATKENILAAFDKVSHTSAPGDVFIFYYAGHGVLNAQGEFYLVPHDITQMYGADPTLAQKGISATLLQQLAKALPAQKQLYLLDACQSAGAIEVAMRGAAEEKAIAQLARSTGTHWLTASGSEQFASEFAQLGHGTFTYALLEALAGKADNGDKRITVREIDAYLQAIVPELTAKYKGTPQYPASYSFGNDFPVGVVR